MHLYAVRTGAGGSDALELHYFFIKSMIMARLTDKGLAGAVGNLVFYVVDGQTRVRSKGGKRPKKRGEKVNPLNSRFGTVSSYGTGMATMMRPYFLFSFTVVTFNAIRSWMYNQYRLHGEEAVWELQAKTNSMCQLNNQTDWRNYLAVTISVVNNGNGQIGIHIPSFVPARDLQAPAQTRQVNLKMMVVTSPFRKAGIQNRFCMEQFRFNYDHTTLAAQDFLLNSQTTAGNVAIVVMAFEFETAASGPGLYVTDLQWLPAAIVAMGRL
jgi:hypothetical protein